MVSWGWEGGKTGPPIPARRGVVCGVLRVSSAGFSPVSSTSLINHFRRKSWRSVQVNRENGPVFPNARELLC